MPVALKAASIEPDRRIPSMDGLRAVSILLVLLAHGFSSHDFPFLPGWAQVAIFHNGPLGVQIFFVLSGYLITGILLSERERKGRIDIKRFYLRRIFRIVPASYLFLSALAALTALGLIAVSGNLLLVSFLYILNYQAVWGGEGEGYWYVAHFWSLCVEQQFYLLWPFVLNRLTLRHAQRALIALALLMPVVRVASYFLFPGLRGQLGMMFHTGSDSIFIGSLTALLLHQFPDWRSRIGGAHWSLAFAAGAFLLVGSVFAHFLMGGVWSLVFSRTVNGSLAAFLLVWSIENSRSKWGQFLNAAPVVYVGAISYGVYLWQQVFLAETATRSVGSVLLGIAGTFATAAFSFHCFERPLLLFGRKLMSAAPKAPVAEGI